MKFITPQQLANSIAQERDIQIIDIREAYEVDSGSIEGALHIPMAEVTSSLQALRTDVPVVIYCHSGKRASAMVHFLAASGRCNNAFCLKGGIEAYAAQVNPEISIYG
jgi:rhodanese-related sulfurtransferase